MAICDNNKHSTAHIKLAVHIRREYSIMAVSDEYLEYVMDQLKEVGRVQPKRMFGGAGLYVDGVFMAIIADDTLYFKVDDSNRKDYEDVGMGPFRPSFKKSKRNAPMSYYEVPVDVLEDEEALGEWAVKAMKVALSKKTAK